MYHDYFDETDAGGLRNPYGPEVPLLPEDRTRHGQRLLLLGVVGAGLSVVVPAAGLATPARIAAADGLRADPPPTVDRP